MGLPLSWSPAARPAPPWGCAGFGGPDRDGGTGSDRVHGAPWCPRHTRICQADAAGASKGVTAPAERSVRAGVGAGPALVKAWGPRPAGRRPAAGSAGSGSAEFLRAGSAVPCFLHRASPGAPRAAHPTPRPSLLAAGGSAPLGSAQRVLGTARVASNPGVGSLVPHCPLWQVTPQQVRAAKPIRSLVPGAPGGGRGAHLLFRCSSGGAWQRQLGQWGAGPWHMGRNRQLWCSPAHP